MCGPAALPAVALGASALAAAGQITSGISQAQQMRAQAKVASRNAALVSEQARDAADRGEIEQRQLGRKYSGLQGQQQAAMAANGIDLGFGSAALTARDTDMLYREDVASTSFNTANEIRGFDITAANYKADASAKRRGATGAIISAGFGAASTALGGAQQFGSLKHRP